MMTRWLCGGACVAVLVAGCSSGASVSANAGNAPLQADVLTLTRAAGAHNWPAATAAMNELRADLVDAVASKQLSAAQAATIRSHLAAVAADVTAQTTPTTTPKSTTPHPKPSPHPKPAPQPPRNKHKGHGGHDGGGDDGGDGGD